MELVIFIIEILGTVAFAISGAMVAREKDMDVFGVIMLGITTGVGGGVIRDVIVGSTPPAVFIQPIYCLVAAVTAAIFCIPRVSANIDERNPITERLLLIVDAFGLGGFTVVAVTNSFSQYPDNLFLMTFVGCVSGVGGGVLRDVFAGKIPYIFRKHIYAIASIACAILCGILLKFIDSTLAMLAGIALVVLIRVLAAHYRLSLPHVNK